MATDTPLTHSRVVTEALYNPLRVSDPPHQTPITPATVSEQKYVFLQAQREEPDPSRRLRAGLS